MVLLFFASLFISVFRETHIGEVMTASMSGVIGNLKFTGVWLIIVSILLIAIANILCPDSLTKWSIISASIVPLFMNASISPEFSQVVYAASDSITNGLTPIFVYYVIYIAFLEKYNKGEMISLRGSLKYMVPYSIYVTIVWLLVLSAWYMIGIPIGIGSFPGVAYGA